MSLRSLLPLAASAALLLSTGRASAEEEDPGPHFRVSLVGEGGLIIFPSVGTSGIFGGQIMAGVQLNKFLGFCAGMDIAVVRGDVAATHVTVPLLVELTFGDRISVGAGPELGVFDTDIHRGLNDTDRVGVAYGGRLHLAWHAIDLGSKDDKLSTLDFGFDLRLRGGGGHFADPWGPMTPGPRSLLAISPVLTFGYSSF